MALQHVAVGSNHHGCRISANPERIAERRFWIQYDQLRCNRPVLRRVGDRRLILTLVDQNEANLRITLCGCNQSRHFAPTGWAPGGPQVDDARASVVHGHRFAAQIMQPQFRHTRARVTGQCDGGNGGQRADERRRCGRQQQRPSQGWPTPAEQQRTQRNRSDASRPPPAAIANIQDCPRRIEVLPPVEYDEADTRAEHADAGEGQRRVVIRRLRKDLCKLAPPDHGRHRQGQQ